MLMKSFLGGCVGLLTIALTAGCLDSGGGGGGNDEARGADGLGGFLWKPRSESNGRLVVLFPTEFRGRHTGAAVHSGNPPSAGNKVEDGRFTSEDDNGDRVHYRFSQPGVAYGQNSWATIYLEDGSTVSYMIPNGAARID